MWVTGIDERCSNICSNCSNAPISITKRLSLRQIPQISSFFDTRMRYRGYCSSFVTALSVCVFGAAITGQRNSQSIKFLQRGHILTCTKQFCLYKAWFCHTFLIVIMCSSIWPPGTLCYKSSMEMKRENAYKKKFDFARAISIVNNFHVQI